MAGSRMSLRLGTRGSELARAQSLLVARRLERLGHDVALVTIRTEGDITARSVREVGGLGVFAAALRSALLASEVDIAVHSLKDLPTAPIDGLILGAVPTRDDPGDVLCARDGLTLQELAPGARVGTGSPRRAAQLRALRPDLTIVEIRGNVGTRLARVHGGHGRVGDLDAVVLAIAGLARLALTSAITDRLPLLPAPGQGALAIECRSDDPTTRDAVAALNDLDTYLAVTVERAILAQLGAGCAAPLGARALWSDPHCLTVSAAAWSNDGSASVSTQQTAPVATEPEAVALGRKVAAMLVADGAGMLTELGATRPSHIADFHSQELWASGTEPALVGRNILLPREDGPLAEAIRSAGAIVTAQPLTRRRPLPFAPPPRADWLVLTSANGVETLTESGHRLGDLGARIAVVGPVTARAVEQAGGTVALRADGAPSGANLAAAFPPGTGTVTLAGSALASPDLRRALEHLGWDVTALHTYTMEPVTSAPQQVVAAWSTYDAVVLTSGSTAQAAHDLLGSPAPTTRIIALGPSTAAAARTLGFAINATATTPTADDVVAALALALNASVVLPDRP